MNEYLAMLLDGDLGKWELRFYAVAVACAGWVLQFAISRFVKRRDVTEKVRHADHVRLGQIDDEVVKSLRGGISFPDLTKEE